MLPPKGLPRRLMSLGESIRASFIDVKHTSASYAPYIPQGEFTMSHESHHPGGEMVAEVKVEEQSEEQLIERGLNGDARALDTLFARNTRTLYQTALRVLGNPEDAEEALQEGLLSAYRNLPRFERRSQFSTWLTRIVINAALMRRRSKRARPAVSLDDVVKEGDVPLRSEEHTS